MREQGFKAQDKKEEKRETTNRLTKDGTTIGKFAPLDGDFEKQTLGN